MLGGTRQCRVMRMCCPSLPESQGPHFYKPYVSKLSQTLISFIANKSFTDAAMEALRWEEKLKVKR